jgi:DNA-binding winged helix-turn-helix (wHTH) protein
VVDSETEAEAGRSPFQVGDWLVEPDLDRISRGDERKTLRPRVTELLVCLAERAGALATKQHLIDQVWHTEFVTVNALTQLIAELRRALGDDPDRPRYIETIPRRGYRLIAETTVHGAPGADDAEAEIRFSLVDENEREFELKSGNTTIGRAPAADIRIDSSEVSRRHARIVVDGASATIEDLGSKNGTYLRGRRLLQRVAIADADEIQIGAELARFRVRVTDDRTRTEARRNGDP